MECGSSPDGKHYPSVQSVIVIIKGEKVEQLVNACWWCGKIM